MNGGKRSLVTAGDSAEYGGARKPSKGALRTILDKYEEESVHEQPPEAPHLQLLHKVQQLPNEITKAASEFGKESLQVLQGQKTPQFVKNPLFQRTPRADESGGRQQQAANKSAQETKESLERLRRMDNFESQDFDAVENDVERATALDKQEHDYHVEEAWKWALSVVIGLLAGFAAFLADATLELFNNWKFGAVKRIIRDNGGFWAPYLAFLTFCLMFSGIASCMVIFGAATAAGSGVPEIKTYLNGVHIRGLLSMRTLVCKLLGVVCSMAGGLVAGKDLVHTGGIIGGGVAGMGSKYLTDLSEGRYIVKLPRWFGGYFRNEADHRDFVAVGMAAGVSTAFSSPVGGLLLMLEEGASFLSVGLFWRGFLATCTGVLTLHFLAQLKREGFNVSFSKFGIRRDLGLYDDDVTNVGRVFFYSMWDIPVFVLMGVVCGSLGALFNRGHVALVHLRAFYMPPRFIYRRLTEVLVVAWLTATVFFFIIYHSPCAKLPPAQQIAHFEAMNDDLDIYAGISLHDSRGFKHFPRLWCKADEFNEGAQLFFSPFMASLRLIVHFGETMPEGIANPYHLSVELLLLYAVAVFILMLFTAGLTAPTGIIVPAMGIGGACGRCLGMLVRHILNSWGFAAVPLSIPAYAVIGAAAMMGGVTRMTLFVPLLVMEGMGAMQLIVPLMITVFAAKMAGDRLTLPMFNIAIKMRGAPVLTECGMDERQKLVADKLTVAELVTTQLVALQPVVRLRELAATLKRCKHQAFPVTPEVDAAFQSDAAFPLHGVIKRVQLLRLIKHRIGMFRLDPNGDIPPSMAQIPATQEARLALLEKLEQFPLKIRATEEEAAILASLTQAELECVIDLRPFMQRTPYIIHGNASLARAYRLFRTMGLHHLFVGPPKPPVIGVLTRKDVTEETAEVFLNDKARKGLLASKAVPESRTSGLPHNPYPLAGPHRQGTGVYPGDDSHHTPLQVIELQGVEDPDTPPPNPVDDDVYKLGADYSEQEYTDRDGLLQHQQEHMHGGKLGSSGRRA